MWWRAILRGIAGSLLGYLILLLVMYPINNVISLPGAVAVALIAIGAGFFGGAVARAGPIAGALLATVGYSLGLTFVPLIYGVYVLIGGLAQGYPDVWHDVREFALAARNIVGSQQIAILAAAGGGAVGGRMPDRVAALFRRILAWLGDL